MSREISARIVYYSTRQFIFRTKYFAKTLIDNFGIRVECGSIIRYSSTSGLYNKVLSLTSISCGVKFQGLVAGSSPRALVWRDMGGGGVLCSPALLVPRLLHKVLLEERKLGESTTFRTQINDKKHVQFLDKFVSLRPDY